MPKQLRTPGHSPALTKTHKLSFAGVATLGAAALAFSLVPAETQASADSVAAAPASVSSQQLKVATVGLSGQLADAQAAAAKKKAADAAAAKKAADAAAKKKAEDARKAKEAASRSAKRAAVKPAAAKTYANNLDGWIRQSLDIMKKHGIPGTYDGLHRNIIRESAGDPNAINNWDINAINGVPSIGLLQVIKPTFDAYHVAGTVKSQYNPVANITAAANYAADRYGSIDNVNGAY
ncbi:MULTISPECIES: transglycosylase SLT domain-containing protein [Streptomyces]|uniref:transglycosylase SLT domain-containing protein n=1 Tax=unclassified Streptomyces TaxID=2593676 RepID=UPI001C2F0A60|nr:MULTISPECIES: transglycosylase SLT domain-containing protein [Streptomyces]MBV1935096.1 transglycosylase SLT domain-containing protein [Streptomyces sp. BV286]WAU80534.1 transglycosylase SLT domain-containing protein [Streptomyces aurantiacus]